MNAMQDCTTHTVAHEYPERDRVTTIPPPHTQARIPWPIQSTESSNTLILVEAYGHGEPPLVHSEVSSDISSLMSPTLRFIQESLRRAREISNNLYRYQQRINVLISDAELDDIPYNPSSEEDFWKFICRIGSEVEAQLALTNSGNIRAVWDTQDEDHLALQFLGNELLEFVVFERRKSPQFVARSAGIDTLNDFHIRIENSGVRRLVHG